MSDDKVTPTFATQFRDSDVASFPDRIACAGCGFELITIQQNVVAKKMDIQVHFTKPPTIVSREDRLGAVECDHCGATTMVDLTMFGAQ